MFKRFATSLFLLFLISLNFLTQINLAQTGCKSCLNSKTNKVNTPADVTSLELSDVELSLPCPPGTKQHAGSCSDESQVISVHTTVSDAEDDPLTSSYTVSGGRIIKTDKNTAEWDLSGVRAGTYTITAAVDDGCGFCGQTKTKAIVIKECSNCRGGDICPVSSASGPQEPVSAGEPLTFTAKVSGVDPDNITYNWTVSGGTITGGQGTSVITVATTKEMEGQTIRASVTISGGFPDFCENKEANATAELKPLSNY